MSREHGQVLVRCPSDWWLLWPQLELMAKGILVKKGVGENDMGDIIGDWRDNLYSRSSFPVKHAFGYAKKVLFSALSDWAKRQKKYRELFDISDFEEELPSDIEVPEEVIMHHEQGIANFRIVQYMRAIIVLNGELLDVKIIDTMWAVWKEDSTLCISECCKIVAERLHLSEHTIYRRFLRLCKKLRTQLRSARLENRLYDDMNLLGLGDYTAAGMAISQQKTAA